MANLAEKTNELLQKQAETLQQTSHQPTSPSLQTDEFDYILSQCTDAELSDYYQPNEPSNQRSTVAGEASSNYKAAFSLVYSSPSHSACVTSSRSILNTGHRSIEGVRTYKRISEQQVKDVSTVLNDANNGAPAAKKCKVT